VKLRITESHWQRIRRITAASFSDALEFPPETGCILLVAENDDPEARSLLVNDILLPDGGDLKDQAGGAVTFSSSYLRRALLTVRERRLKGFFTLHTHPLSMKQVSFSPYDDAHDPSLMENLYDLQPTGVFGSVVLGREAIAARIWNSVTQQPHYLQTLVIVGEQLTFLPLNGRLSPPPLAAEIFDRAIALSGAGALATLRKMRIAVVGASGTGSLMVELLLRAGVGEIVLFDFDKADTTNLNRVLHLRLCDAEAQSLKAKRLATVVNESGLPTQITVVNGGDIRDEEIAQELRGCDLIIGCVDRDWPRLIMCEVAYQYLIPYLDLGTEIGATENEIQSVDARVSFVGPGRPCLLCSGVITQERIRLEGYEPAERARVLDMGYSKDIRLKAPSVMDLNMRAASAAMLIVRHLIQPFLRTPLPHTFKEAVTNFNNRQLRFEPNANCIVCGFSDREGAGALFPFTTRRAVLELKN
jgi:hypothetical protein